jgi:hypothetical protein
LNIAKKLSNKRALSLLAIVLALSMVIPMTTLSFASAHAPAWNIPTYAYIQAAIDPVQVGNTATVYMWLDKMVAGALMTGNDIRFHDYKLVITAPDGTTKTQTWNTIADTTSSQTYSFTPDQVGTYNFNFSFPGQTYTWNQTTNPELSAANALYYGDYYMPSNATCTLTVIEETTISATGGTAMPTEYWTRPIYGENSYWYSISSNWLGTPGATATNQGYGSCYRDEYVGSQTAHVMWTKPIQDGGIVGGNLSTVAGASYFEGTAYLGRYKNPIIVAGKLYYTEPVSFVGAVSGDTVCVDLRTGEEYWRSSTVPALSHALVWDVRNPNQYGTYNPILVARPTTTSWTLYDAYTGKWLFNATGIPSGTTEVGPNGEYLIYSLTNCGTTANPAWYFARWNSTKLWTFGNTPSYTSVVDASTAARYDFNVSVRFDGMYNNSNSVLVAYDNNFAICRSNSYPGIGATTGYSWTYFRLDLEDLTNSSTSATIDWRKTVDAPTGNLSISYSGADFSTGVFIEKYKETMQYTGFSMKTGEKLWTTDGDQPALYYYSSGYNAGGNMAGATYAYGKLYVTGMAGIMYCYDLTDGSLLWTFGNGGVGNSTYSGAEVPGYYPMTTYAVGNGIIYTTVTEHTVNTPIYKGAMALAINATDGTEVWKLRAVTEEAQQPTTGAIADGFNTFLNGYDNQIYVLGRGSSKTTVEVPTASTTSGGFVLLQGTVTDTSSGTTQDEQAARFPDGVPVAADSIMTEWMAYIYEQQAKPTNFTGVEVTLNIVDANGNYRAIGTTTTDSTGFYSLVWQPDIEGKYTVYATFTGTKAYWGSAATTAFNIEQAPATATPQPTAAPSAADLYFLPAIAGLFAAIVVVGLLIVVVLRKRP